MAFLAAFQIRCGIVLCARDAKFAVDCDTCKMSYCLVCLASGTKDPCVRCGHRPSKRVEQLVHLRLKSIYKAFKQSGASVGPGGGSGGSGGGGSLGPGPPGTGSNPGSNPGNVLSGSGGCSHLADASGKNAAGRDISTIGGKYSSALRSLTENESLGLRGMDSSKDSFCNFDQSMANEVAAVLQTASNAMSNTDGGDFSDNNRRTRGKRISSHPSIAPNDHNAPPHGPSPGSTRSHRPSTFSEHSTSTRSSNSAAERYFRKTQAEMEAAAAAAEAEAEAAAASLLAELDEEKATSNASKKSKKKKKKKDKKKESTIDDVSSGSKANPTNIDSIDNASQTSASIEKNAEKTVAPQKSKPSKKSSNAKSASKESLFQEEDSTDDEDMNFEQLVVRSKTNSRPSKKEKKDEDVDENELLIASNKLSIKPALEAPVTDDPITDFDKELADLLSDDDEDGLENFLANLRGVPGLSALRKNAKKALKRIKEAKEASAQPEPEKPQLRSSSTHHTQPFMSEVELQPTKIVPKAALASINARTIPAATTSTAATNTTPSPSASTPHEPLLRVVSRTQSTVTAASSRGGGSNSASVPAAARAECVMHMSPSVVGWVIGKGGQRIRDMMEESGAKIWIDQESMGAKESRVVYVSGKRSAVDAAVRMVKDLVAKAPVAASAAAAQGMVPVPSVAATPASSIVKSSPPMVPATVAPPSTVQNPRPLEAGKDQQPIALSQQSLVAAISSNSSTPIALTSSGQKPSVTAKTSVPTQVWALPDSVGNIHEPSPQNIKIASKSSGAQAIEVAPLVKDQPKNLDSVSRGAEQLPGTMTKELVCDPRFVALLIGRRGWTVKNIQAESGANLHIDQSVEPPKIIISGNVGNVKKAEQLVREVLNYPQMQLNQEALGQNNDAGMEGMTTGALNVIDTGALLSSGLQTTPEYINGIHVLSTRSEHMAGDLRAKSDNSTILSMPMPANMHRDSLSSTPDLSDGRQLQNQHPNQSSAQAAETMVCLFNFVCLFQKYHKTAMFLILFVSPLCRAFHQDTLHTSSKTP